MSTPTAAEVTEIIERWTQWPNVALVMGRTSTQLLNGLSAHLAEQLAERERAQESAPEASTPVEPAPLPIESTDVAPACVTPQHSVSQARAWLRERLHEGTDCPVCTQRAQVYRRKLNSGMVRSLVVMYRSAPVGEYIHIPTVVGGKSREEGKLRYWRLVEESPEPREDGGRAGWWRVTPQGAAFVQQQTRVPRYALVYDHHLIRLEGEPIDIHEALGSRFNLRDLLETSSAGPV